MRLPPARALARAALIGAATGSRSFTGMAALALAPPAAASTQPDRTLRAGWMKALATSAALAELVADQLPAAPDRLAPRGLAPRVLVAAFTGLAVARRAWPPRAGDPVPAEPAPPGDGDSAPADPAPPADGAAATAAVAMGTALAAAWLGSRWRRVAARHFGRDWPGAVIEDAAALSLAWAAVRS
jgi:uncharacterized membrane protein